MRLGKFRFDSWVFHPFQRTQEAKKEHTSDDVTPSRVVGVGLSGESRARSRSIEAQAKLQKVIQFPFFSAVVTEMSNIFSELNSASIPASNLRNCCGLIAIFRNDSQIFLQGLRHVGGGIVLFFGPSG